MKVEGPSLQLAKKGKLLFIALRSRGLKLPMEMSVDVSIATVVSPLQPPASSPAAAATVLGGKALISGANESCVDVGQC